MKSFFDVWSLDVEECFFCLEAKFAKGGEVGSGLGCEAAFCFLKVCELLFQVAVFEVSIQC